jgi:hypothetical protein
MSIPPTPIPLIGRFAPVNPVVPFTLRDTASFLTILHGLREHVDTLTEHINTQDADNHSAWQKAIDDLTNALNLAILNVYNDLLERVDVGADSLADDPTTGKRNMGLSRVVGNVFDNVRIFAYFAGQYDALNLTAADFDALNYSARHFDLAPLYPTLNDVYPAGV